jgi:hypothetical protein
MKFFVEHWLKFLIPFTVVFLARTIYLYFWKGNIGVNNYSDNIEIEFVVGGLFLFVPLLIGFGIAKKEKEIRFYDNIQGILNKIKDLRESGGIKREAARNLVIEISESMGKDILQEPWFKRKFESSITNYEQKECRVCGMDAVITSEKRCGNCKLNCFAWETEKIESKTNG